MEEALRIQLPCLVVIVLSLYLYDCGARRFYDAVISAAAIILTSPVTIALAIMGKIKRGAALCGEAGSKKFAYPNNALANLTVLFYIFIGKKNLLPKRLKDIRL